MGKGQCRGFRLKGKGQVMCVEVIGSPSRDGACVGACMCVCVCLCVCMTLIHAAGMSGTVLGTVMLSPREIDSEVEVSFRGSLGDLRGAEARPVPGSAELGASQAVPAEARWTNHWCGLDLG